MSATIMKAYDLARMTTATTGTGTLSLGSAVTGFLTFAAAGAQDQDILSYSIWDSVTSNSETGWGVYSSGAQTLTRNVFNSTNGNTPISLSGSAQVMVSPLAASLSQFPKLLNTVTNSTAAAYLTDTTSLANPNYQSFTVKLLSVGAQTSNTTLAVQFYANGSWQTSGYKWTLDGNSSGGMGATQNYSDTGICITYPGTAGVSGNWQGRNATFDINTPALPGTTLFGTCGGYASDAAGPQTCQFSGGLNTAYAVTGIRVYALSGNIIGTMKIIGNP